HPKATPPKAVPQLHLPTPVQPPVAKLPKQIVTPSPRKAAPPKIVSVPSLPHDPGPGAHPTKLPAGIKPAPVKEVVKNLHLAQVKRPTKDVSIALKQYQPHALAVRQGMYRDYAHRGWFGPNWWNAHRAVLPYWHYSHSYHQPSWWWWRPATWLATTSWLG